jgi:hypothetical protein
LYRLNKYDSADPKKPGLAGDERGLRDFEVGTELINLFEESRDAFCNYIV